MRTIVIAIVILASSIGRIFAHGQEIHHSGPSWTFDPWVVVSLLVLAAPYAIGSLVLWQRTLIGWRHQGRQTLTFLAGWLTLVAALVSPLHWLGERLLSFHMIEHEILMAVSAPLLVMGRPIAALLWSLPRGIRIAVGRFLRRPAISRTWAWLSAGRSATVLHGVAIWGWHAPILFNAAVTNEAIHRLQHLSFLLTAVLFWWSVLQRDRAGPAA